MTIYYQVATEKENPSATDTQINPWFVHYKQFESLDEARVYARKFKVCRIIKSEVIQELSTYKCDRCEGGIVHNTWDVGDFDTCDNCEGTGKVFFLDSKLRDY